MLKAEVTAAWGLLEEDSGTLAGRSTADEGHTYEWWSATYRAVRVAEGEGGRVEVVGALVL